ncbi:MAG: hypothetical protein K8I27_10350 [Planctomycetes bacterium]|nr:hypothetical protein [Planctomycetota bacterium]
MKWTALSIAGLLALTLTVPGLAQEAKPEARTVMLKQKLTKELKITDESTDVTTQTVTLTNGMVVQTQTETESQLQVTEILEVAEDGSATKVRVRWTHGTTETIRSQMNQQGQLVEGEPVTEASPHKGASVLHTWNAEKKAWENTLEKGDKEASKVKKQLTKKDPLANPLIPNREVKVGDKWDADEQGLKDFFGSPDAPKVTKATGKLKAEEIVEEEGAEYLRVSFEIVLTLDNMGKDLDATSKGNYYFNIKEGRVALVEMEMGAALEDEHPELGKLAIAIEGTLAIEAAYGKVGDKDREPSKAEEEEEEEEGGMDG